MHGSHLSPNLSEAKALKQGFDQLKMLMLDDFIGAFSQDAIWLKDHGGNRRVNKSPSIVVIET